MTTPPLTDRETRLYAVLFEHVIETLHGVATRSGNRVRCAICNGMAPTRAAVRHAPGCVFAELSAQDVAALAEWEAVGT